MARAQHAAGSQALFERADDSPGLTGVRVSAYRNLHVPGRAYSLRATASGRVVARVLDVTLTNVRLHVQPAGRDRARRDGVRNVHAFATGTIACPAHSELLHRGGQWRTAAYDPFRYDSFVDRQSRHPLLRAAAVRLGPDGLLYQLEDGSTTAGGGCSSACPPPRLL